MQPWDRSFAALVVGGGALPQGAPPPAAQGKAEGARLPMPSYKMEAGHSHIYNCANLLLLITGGGYI